jgi:tetratricopeptide (TPR) repeat protein
MLTTQTKEASEKQFADKEKLPVLLEPGNPFSVRQQGFVEPTEVNPFGTLEPIGEAKPRSETSAFMANILESRMDSAIVDLGRHPKNPHVMNNAGLALLNAGKVDEAERLFKQALELAPDLMAPKANLAKAYTLGGRGAQATRIYEEIVGADPQNIIALMNLAQLYATIGRLNEAEALFNRVISLDKENSSAYNNRGVIRLISQRFQEAISDFRSAARINLRDASVYNNLGVAYALTKNTKRAINALKTGLTVEPWNEGATKNLARLYQSIGKIQPSVLLLTEYLQRVGEDLEARNLLARAYFLSEEFDLSSRQLTLALRVAEKTGGTTQIAEVLNNIGTVSKARGRIKDAMEYLERAISVDPEAILPKHNLVGLLFDQDNLELGKSILERCIERSPENPVSLTLMGTYYALKEQYQESLAVLEQAIAVDQKTTLPYAVLGLVLGDLLGQFAKVVERLEPVVKRHPEDVWLLNNLAYGYLMLDNTRAAREILDRVVQKDQNLFLTATRGLLMLKEGNVQEGRRLYNLAAARANTSELRDLVRQKKELELAHYFVRRGDLLSARKHLDGALEIRTRRPYFRRQLRELQRELDRH